MAAYFISDLHLKTDTERNSQKLLRFLLDLQKNPVGTLVLLGDIFDVWVGPHQFFAKRFNSITAALEALNKQGWRLIYFEGNHDVHIDGYFSRIGFEVYTTARYFDLEGLIVRLEHGDEINQDDTSYLAYREKIRRPSIRFLAHIFPGLFWQWIGSKASERSRDRNHQHTPEKREELIQMIRAHAQKAFSEKSFNVIISGHMHIKDDFIDPQFRSINLGSWYSPEASILKIENRNLDWLIV